MKRVIPLICLLGILSTNLVFAEEQEPVKILITGSLSPQGMERIGKPITVVGAEEIAENKEGTIGDILSNKPGISSSYFGPGAGRPIIRGQGRERVRVIENGLENGDVSATSDDHLSVAEPLTTERIDILRGPSTLLFGSQAIGGVVNIIDRAIAEENIGKDLEGKFSLSGGDSATGEFAGALVLQGEQEGINWHLSGSSRESNDIEIPGFGESDQLRAAEEAAEEEDHDEEDHDEHEEEEEVRGRLLNSDSESSSIKGGVSHVWDDGFFGASLRVNDSNYGIPGGGHSHSNEPEEAEDVRIDLEQIRLETRGAIHLHDDHLDSVRFGASYSDYEHDELEGDEVGTRYDRKAFEGRVLLTHHHEDYLEGGFGLQFNYDDLEVRGSEAFIPSSTSFAPAAFFVEDFAISDNYVWQVGGRYENSEIDPVGLQSENFHLFSGSTGIIWHDLPREYSVAVNLSYSERAPNSAELFADGVHVASQIFEVGDTSIDKERSIGTELILRKLKGKTRGTLTTFIQRYNDYISLNEAGFEAEGVSVFEYGNTDARFWGIEGELVRDLVDWREHLLSLNLGFDLVRGRDTSRNSNLPRITPVRTSVGLDYRYRDLSASIDSVFVEEQDKVSQFELPTDSYSLLNAGIKYLLDLKKGKKLELFLKGTNLTNEEARIHTSFLKDVAPLRGRAFFFGLTGYF